MTAEARRILVQNCSYKYCMCDLKLPWIFFFLQIYYWKINSWKFVLFQSDIKLWNDLALPFTVSAINYLLPFIFSIFVGWERYKNPRTALYLTMLRTMTLYCVTLGVIVAFWFTKIDCPDYSTTESDPHCRPVSILFTLKSVIVRLIELELVYIFKTTWHFWLLMVIAKNLWGFILRYKWS